MQVAVIPIHLGVHLTKLLGPRALSAEGLARAANLPTTVVDALIGARQILTADIAVALAEVLGVSALELLELGEPAATGLHFGGEQPRKG